MIDILKTISDQFEKKFGAQPDEKIVADINDFLIEQEKKEFLECHLKAISHTQKKEIQTYLKEKNMNEFFEVIEKIGDKNDDKKESSEKESSEKVVKKSSSKKRKKTNRKTNKIS